MLRKVYIPQGIAITLAVASKWSKPGLVNITLLQKHLLIKYGSLAITNKSRKVFERSVGTRYPEYFAIDFGKASSLHCRVPFRIYAVGLAHVALGAAASKPPSVHLLRALALSLHAV